MQRVEECYGREGRRTPSCLAPPVWRELYEKTLNRWIDAYELLGNKTHTHGRVACIGQPGSFTVTHNTVPSATSPELFFQPFINALPFYRHRESPTSGHNTALARYTPWHPGLLKKRLFNTHFHIQLVLFVFYSSGIHVDSDFSAVISCRRITLCDDLYSRHRWHFFPCREHRRI